MVSIKTWNFAHFKHHLVLLISLSVAVTETRNHDSTRFNSESIVYPDDYILQKTHLDTGRITSLDKSVHLKYDIPAEHMKKMNNIDDPEVLEKYFIEGDLPISSNGVSLGTRFGGSSGNENFVSRPPVKFCKPQPTLVTLEASKPEVLLMPSCLTVPRCGGCCFFGWKCLPDITEAFTYSIKETEYQSKTQRFMIKRLFNVTEEHHTSCKCKCAVKPKDCFDRGQIYDKSKCKCVCQNELENRFRCSQRGRQWNSDSCTCDCPVVPCEEGYFFDQEKCKCDF